MIRVYNPEVTDSVKNAFRSNIPDGYVELPDGEEPRYKPTGKGGLVTPQNPARPAQEPHTAEATADANPSSKE